MEKLAIRQIRLGDDEILRKKCKEVKVVDAQIKVLLEDMLETLHNA